MQGESRGEAEGTRVLQRSRLNSRPRPQAQAHEATAPALGNPGVTF